MPSKVWGCRLTWHHMWKLAEVGWAPGWLGLGRSQWRGSAQGVWLLACGKVALQSEM
jgi:hypothetical protein